MINAIKARTSRLVTQYVKHVREKKEIPAGAVLEGIRENLGGLNGVWDTICHRQWKLDFTRIQNELQNLALTKDQANEKVKALDERFMADTRQCIATGKLSQNLPSVELPTNIWSRKPLQS